MLDESRVSGVYEEIYEYEAINIKPRLSPRVQQRPLPSPIIPAAENQECKLTPCPPYIPTHFPGYASDRNAGVDGQYEGQSSSEGKVVVEGEYDNVEVGQSSSDGRAAEGEYDELTMC